MDKVNIYFNKKKVVLFLGKLKLTLKLNLMAARNFTHGQQKAVKTSGMTEKQLEKHFANN